MSSRKITEMLAVERLKLSLLKTRLLDPAGILDNSTEPSWDGHIHVYNDENWTKESHRGKVSIQVKGTINNDFSAKQIKFSAEVADLKCYLRDGGAIYFVVYISTRGQTKIYYSALTPVKLICILKTCEGQKSVRITLEEFPADTNAKMNVFINFLADSKKQASFDETTMLSVDKLRAEGGKIRQLTLSVLEVKKGRKKDANPFLENDVYAYAITEAGSVPIPILLQPGHYHIQVEVPGDVTVNGKQFYTSYKRVDTKYKSTLKIGESFTITVDSITETSTIDYNPAPYLTDRLIDAEFWLAVVQEKGLEINGRKLNLALFDDAETQRIIEETKEKLETLKKVKLVFERLRIDKKIDLSKLTKSEQHYLDTLIKVFVDGDYIYNKKLESTPFVGISIQGVNIALVATKDPTNPDRYILSDFFEKPYAIYCILKDSGERYLVPQYCVLKKEDWLKLSNINYEAIAPAYQSLIAGNPLLLDHALHDMLQLISIYDESGNKNLLNVAEKICYVLISQRDARLAIDVINLFQIKKRQRPLIEEEISMLFEIAESCETTDPEKVGAHLLLENYQMAKRLFNKLTQEQQIQFKQYPIYRFYKDIV